MFLITSLSVVLNYTEAGKSESFIVTVRQAIGRGRREKGRKGGRERERRTEKGRKRGREGVREE